MIYYPKSIWKQNMYKKSMFSDWSALHTPECLSRDPPDLAELQLPTSLVISCAGQLMGVVVQQYLESHIHTQEHRICFHMILCCQIADMWEERNNMVLLHQVWQIYVINPIHITLTFTDGTQGYTTENHTFFRAMVRAHLGARSCAQGVRAGGVKPRFIHYLI